MQSHDDLPTADTSDQTLPLQSTEDTVDENTSDRVEQTETITVDTIATDSPPSQQEAPSVDEVTSVLDTKTTLEGGVEVPSAAPTSVSEENIPITTEVNEEIFEEAPVQPVVDDKRTETVEETETVTINTTNDRPTSPQEGVPRKDDASSTVDTPTTKEVSEIPSEVRERSVEDILPTEEILEVVPVQSVADDKRTETVTTVEETETITIKTPVTDTSSLPEDTPKTDDSISTIETTTTQEGRAIDTEEKPVEGVLATKEDVAITTGTNGDIPVESIVDDKLTDTVTTDEETEIVQVDTDDNKSPTSLEGVSQAKDDTSFLETNVTTTTEEDVTTETQPIVQGNTPIVTEIDEEILETAPVDSSVEDKRAETVTTVEETETVTIDTTDTDTTTEERAETSGKVPVEPIEEVISKPIDNQGTDALTAVEKIETVSLDSLEKDSPTESDVGSKTDDAPSLPESTVATNATQEDVLEEESVEEKTPIIAEINQEIEETVPIDSSVRDNRTETVTTVEETTTVTINTTDTDATSPQEETTKLDDQASVLDTATTPEKGVEIPSVATQDTVPIETGIDEEVSEAVPLQSIVDDTRTENVTTVEEIETVSLDTLEKDSPTESDVVSETDDAPSLPESTVTTNTTQEDVAKEKTPIIAEIDEEIVEAVPVDSLTDEKRTETVTTAEGTETTITQDDAQVSSDVRTEMTAEIEKKVPTESIEATVEISDEDRRTETVTTVEEIETVSLDTLEKDSPTESDVGSKTDDASSLPESTVTKIATQEDVVEEKPVEDEAPIIAEIDEETVEAVPVDSLSNEKRTETVTTAEGKETTINQDDAETSSDVRTEMTEEIEKKVPTESIEATVEISDDDKRTETVTTVDEIETVKVETLINDTPVIDQVTPKLDETTSESETSTITEEIHDEKPNDQVSPNSTAEKGLTDQEAVEKSLDSTDLALDERLIQAEDEQKSSTTVVENNGSTQETQLVDEIKIAEEQPVSMEISATRGEEGQVAIDTDSVSAPDDVSFAVKTISDAPSTSVETMNEVETEQTTTTAHLDVAKNQEQTASLIEESSELFEVPLQSEDTTEVDGNALPTTTDSSDQSQNLAEMDATTHSTDQVPTEENTLASTQDETVQEKDLVKPDEATSLSSDTDLQNQSLDEQLLPTDEASSAVTEVVDDKPIDNVLDTKDDTVPTEKDEQIATKQPTDTIECVTEPSVEEQTQPVLEQSNVDLSMDATSDSTEKPLPTSSETETMPEEATSSEENVKPITPIDEVNKTEETQSNRPRDATTEEEQANDTEKPGKNAAESTEELRAKLKEESFDAVQKEIQLIEEQFDSLDNRVDSTDATIVPLPIEVAPDEQALVVDQPAQESKETTGEVIRAAEEQNNEQAVVNAQPTETVTTTEEIETISLETTSDNTVPSIQDNITGSDEVAPAIDSLAANETLIEERPNDQVDSTSTADEVTTEENTQKPTATNEESVEVVPEESIDVQFETRADEKQTTTVTTVEESETITVNAIDVDLSLPQKDVSETDETTRATTEAPLEGAETSQVEDVDQDSSPVTDETTKSDATSLSIGHVGHVTTADEDSSRVSADVSQDKLLEDIHPTDEEQTETVTTIEETETIAANSTGQDLPSVDDQTLKSNDVEAVPESSALADKPAEEQPEDVLQAEAKEANVEANTSIKTEITEEILEAVPTLSVVDDTREDTVSTTHSEIIEDNTPTITDISETISEESIEGKIESVADDKRTEMVTTVEEIETITVNTVAQDAPSVADIAEDNTPTVTEIHEEITKVVPVESTVDEERTTTATIVDENETALTETLDKSLPSAQDQVPNTETVTTLEETETIPVNTPDTDTSSLPEDTPKTDDSISTIETTTTQEGRAIDTEEKPVEGVLATEEDVAITTGTNGDIPVESIVDDKRTDTVTTVEETPVEGILPTEESEIKEEILEIVPEQTIEGKIESVIDDKRTRIATTVEETEIVPVDTDDNKSPSSLEGVSQAKEDDTSLLDTTTKITIEEDVTEETQPIVEENTPIVTEIDEEILETAPVDSFVEETETTTINTTDSSVSSPQEKTLKLDDETSVPDNTTAPEEEAEIPSVVPIDVAEEVLAESIEGTTTKPIDERETEAIKTADENNLNDDAAVPTRAEDVADEKPIQPLADDKLTETVTTVEETETITLTAAGQDLPSQGEDASRPDDTKSITETSATSEEDVDISSLVSTDVDDRRTETVATIDEIETVSVDTLNNDSPTESDVGSKTDDASSLPESTVTTNATREDVVEENPVEEETPIIAEIDEETVEEVPVDSLTNEKRTETVTTVEETETTTTQDGAQVSSDVRTEMTEEIEEKVPIESIEATVEISDDDKRTETVTTVDEIETVSLNTLNNDSPTENDAVSKPDEATPLPESTTTQEDVENKTPIITEIVEAVPIDSLVDEERTETVTTVEETTTVTINTTDTDATSPQEETTKLDDQASVLDTATTPEKGVEIPSVATQDTVPIETGIDEEVSEAVPLQSIVDDTRAETVTTVEEIETVSLDTLEKDSPTESDVVSETDDALSLPESTVNTNTTQEDVAKEKTPIIAEIDEEIVEAVPVDSLTDEKRIEIETTVEETETTITQDDAQFASDVRTEMTAEIEKKVPTESIEATVEISDEDRRTETVTTVEEIETMEVDTVNRDSPSPSEEIPKVDEATSVLETISKEEQSAQISPAAPTEDVVESQAIVGEIETPIVSMPDADLPASREETTEPDSTVPSTILKERTLEETTLSEDQVDLTEGKTPIAEESNDEVFEDVPSEFAEQNEQVTSNVSSPSEDTTKLDEATLVLERMKTNETEPSADEVTTVEDLETTTVNPIASDLPSTGEDVPEMDETKSVPDTTNTTGEDVEASPQILVDSNDTQEVARPTTLPDVAENVHTDEDLLLQQAENLNSADIAELPIESIPEETREVDQRDTNEEQSVVERVENEKVSDLAATASNAARA